MAALGHGIFPEMIGRVMSLVDGLLPSGKDRRPRSGSQSGSLLAPSILTRASDAAARRNNE
jgi:hypothetical protein